MKEPILKDTAGSSDEESTRPDTGAAFDIAVRKVVRRLFDVMVARDAIEAALRASEVSKLHGAAQDLSAHWQAAQRELKALEARAREVREHVRQAHTVTDQHRGVLDELFRRVQRATRRGRYCCARTSDRRRPRRIACCSAAFATKAHSSTDMEAMGAMDCRQRDREQQTKGEAVMGRPPHMGAIE